MKDLAEKFIVNRAKKLFDGSEFQLKYARIKGRLETRDENWMAPCFNIQRVRLWYQNPNSEDYLLVRFGAGSEPNYYLQLPAGRILRMKGIEIGACLGSQGFLNNTFHHHLNDEERSRFEDIMVKIRSKVRKDARNLIDSTLEQQVGSKPLVSDRSSCTR